MNLAENSSMLGICTLVSTFIFTFALPVAVYVNNNTWLPEQQHESIRESSEVIVSVDRCGGVEFDGSKHLQTIDIYKSFTFFKFFINTRF